MEKNKQQNPLPVWVWVVGLLLAVLLVLLLTRPVAETGSQPIEGATEGTSFSSAVKDFVDFVEEEYRLERDADRYTSKGLKKMVYALGQMVEATNVQIGEIHSMVARASGISDFIQSPEVHSEAKLDSIETAFLHACEIIEKIQEQEFPELASEVRNLKINAEMIESTILSLGQKEAVENFFRESASILVVMAGEYQAKGEK